MSMKRNESRSLCLFLEFSFFYLIVPLLYRSSSCEKIFILFFARLVFALP